MKTFNGPFRLLIAFSALAFLFTSCQKQLTDDVSTTIQQEEVPVYSTSHGCKPTVLGVYVEPPGGTPYWRTLMQKWYGGDGKLAFLKARGGTDFNTYENFLINLEWGEVTYPAPNQVVVRDVLNNNVFMRVTTTPDGKPAATYFRTVGTTGQTFIDTSYYYFTGDRLDQIISISRILPGGNNVFRKFSFFYDMHGNLIRAETGDTAGSFKMHIRYNYAKPVTDMLPAHYINLPQVMVDYLDLFHFAVHHEITSVVLGEYQPGSPFPDQTLPLQRWMYTNYVKDGMGLVTTYEDEEGSHDKTFYTGWQCTPSGPTPPLKINSLKDFKAIY